MRRILPLLLVPLALAACQDASAPLAPSAGASLARGGIPGAPGGITIQSVVASISGPSSVGYGQTCDYTGLASGGTAPYSYRWIPSYTSGSSYFVGGAGPITVFHGTAYYYGGGTSGPVSLYLEVTDALGVVGTTTKYITAYSTAIGCI
jgi:hypothetical protein